VRKLWTSLALGVLLATGCDRGSHPGNIDKPAQQFTLSDGGRSVDLSKLRGRVVVLNLWATWCAPCIEELPSLLALQHKMPDLEIVAVSMDQDPDVYHKFLTDHHVDILTFRDADQRINALYGTVQIPETYIIDKQGILRRKFIGAQNWTSPEITGYLARM
jgi:cytochrome c biogenesis protein CcmG/thiol:disulfide interchange protein DsbE